MALRRQAERAPKWRPQSGSRAACAWRTALASQKQTPPLPFRPFCFGHGFPAAFAVWGGYVRFRGVACVPLAVKPRPSRQSFLLGCRLGALDSVSEAFKRFREVALGVPFGRGSGSQG